MCRHLAYLGPPATLRSVLIDPPHGLYQQAWAPRRQRYGTVNADGFGVGWYAPDDPDPARYRHAGPMWADESFADLAPFASGQWLFSHNGKVEGWPESVAGLAATLPAVALLELEARVDSALLWALILARLRRGAGPAEAIADTTRALDAAGVTGRFNFLLTDGRVIAASAAGDSLWYRPSGPSGPSVVVASEPDDEPGWTEVPDGSVITATPHEVTVTRLDVLARETATEDGRIAIR
jgi:gamma-glutamyl hercynylcysteine S-oxide hydrolase